MNKLKERDEVIKEFLEKSSISFNQKTENTIEASFSTNELLKNTTALILAGGQGTRLKNLTKNIAKPAVSFGGKYKIIDFTLSNCINSGVRNIGILTQYMAHELIEHIHKGWGFFNTPTLNEGVSVIPAQQRTGEHWYRGTADAVYQNLDLINQNSKKHVLILGGDHVYKMDYSKLLEFHAKNKADVTIACVEKDIKDASSFGVMSLNEKNRVIKFREKPMIPEACKHDSNKALVSMGIYIFNIEILNKELEIAISDPSYNHDFGHHIIPKLVDKCNVYGYNFNGEEHPNKSSYWRDVGNVDDYFDANMDLLSPDPELNIYNEDWPIITQQQQRPGAKFIFNEENRKGFATDSIISAGSIISGANINHSLVSYSCKVDEGTTVENSILLPNVTIGRNCKIKNVIINENTHIPDNTIIGYDNKKDKERYFISPKGIVLVP